VTASREERLARWERLATPWIVVAAVVPLFDVFTEDDTYSTAKLVVALACWAVYAALLASFFNESRGGRQRGGGGTDGREPAE